MKHQVPTPPWRLSLFESALDAWDDRFSVEPFSMNILHDASQLAERGNCEATRTMLPAKHRTGSRPEQFFKYDERRKIWDVGALAA
jgi:hypothetical protein